MSNANKFLVGYISEKIIIKNEIIIFEPVNQFDEILKEVRNNFHEKDGFYFPVTSQVRYAHDFEKGKDQLKEVLSLLFCVNIIDYKN